MLTSTTVTIVPAVMKRKKRNIKKRDKKKRKRLKIENSGKKFDHLFMDQGQDLCLIFLVEGREFKRQPRKGVPPNLLQPLHHRTPPPRSLPARRRRPREGGGESGGEGGAGNDGGGGGGDLKGSGDARNFRKYFSSLTIRTENPWRFRPSSGRIDADH
jgi:uncharacterized membrane protein YgcG